MNKKHRLDIETCKHCIMIFTYIPPFQSPYYEGHSDKNGVHALSDFVSILKNSFMNSPLILCGDLNSCISNCQPLVECDNVDKFLYNNYVLSQNLFPQ